MAGLFEVADRGFALIYLNLLLIRSEKGSHPPLIFLLILHNLISALKITKKLRGWLTSGGNGDALGISFVDFDLR